MKPKMTAVVTLITTADANEQLYKSKLQTPNLVSTAFDTLNEMDLFNLITAPNPTKVKTGTRPRVAYEVPLLTATTIRVINMEELATTTESSGTLCAIENRQVGLEEPVAAMGPPVSKKHRKRGNDGTDANAPPKVLKKDHTASRPTQSTAGGKSLASIRLEAGSTLSASVSQETLTNVSHLNPLSYTKPQSTPESSKATASEIPVGDVGSTKVNVQVFVGSPDSGRSSSATSVMGSHSGIYQPGVTSGYGFSTEAENQTSNLKTLLEAKVDMKKAAKAKNVELSKELDSLRFQFLDLQVSNSQLSQQISILQAQVTGEERIKVVFEKFKKYEDDRVEQRCAEMDACLIS
ncbi:hypothetical protein Tco_0322169 [Tanacetum coccineum]